MIDEFHKAIEPAPNGPLRRKERNRLRREDGKRLNNATKINEAADRAAAMVLGEYEFPEDARHRAKPGEWTYKALVESLDYGDAIVADKTRPAWYPGTERFSRIVNWKVTVRKMQSNIDFSAQNAWAGPLLGMAVEEMGRRLAENPDKVSDRDLTDLLTKMARMFVTQQEKDGPKTVNTFNIVNIMDKMPSAMKDRMLADADAASAAVRNAIEAKLVAR